MLLSLATYMVATMLYISMQPSLAMNIVATMLYIIDATVVSNVHSCYHAVHRAASIVYGNLPLVKILNIHCQVYRSSVIVP